MFYFKILGFIRGEAGEVAAGYGLVYHKKYVSACLLNLMYEDWM